MKTADEKSEIKKLLIKLSCDYLKFTKTCFYIVFSSPESNGKFSQSEFYIFNRIMDVFDFVPYLIVNIDSGNFVMDFNYYKIYKTQLEYFIKLYEDDEFKKKEIKEESHAIVYWLSYLKDSLESVKLLNEKLVYLRG